MGIDQLASVGTHALDLGEEGSQRAGVQGVVHGEQNIHTRPAGVRR